MPKDKILEILKTALKIESDGVGFYSMASKGAQNDAAKKIFAFLSEEEKKHYDFFLKHFKTLERGKKYDYASEVQNLQSISKNAKEVFTDEFIKRLSGDNHSLTAVSIGVQLEKNAIDFYKNQMTDATEENEKKYYQFLIDSEIYHHKFLVGIEKEILEESWAQNRFSPF